MITLDRKGQWYEFFERFGVYPSNLCALFWSGVFFPALCIFAGVVGFVIIAYSLLGWAHVIAWFFGVPWPFFIKAHFSTLATALVIIETFALCTWFLVSTGIAAGKKIGKVAETTGTADVVKQAYHGFKDKYCPLVEWK